MDEQVELTEGQVKFLELVKEYEQVKKNLKESSDLLDSVMANLRMGSYFQDPTTLAVYHIVAPTGTFVPFRSVSYERTALEGETKGSLSKKEAVEKGFYLGK